MRNRFAGVCDLCKKIVHPKQGHFQRKNGGWIVKHAECVIKDRERREQLNSLNPTRE